MNRNKNFVDSVDTAAKLPEPTEDEMKAYVKSLGAEWDDLNTFERNTAKRTLMAERKFDIVNQTVQSTRQIDAWSQKVDDYLDDETTKSKFPKLAGREIDFKTYAMKKTHRGADMEILIKSFFFDVKPKAPRRSLFETANGGEGKKTTGKSLSADEISSLRKNNQKEYQRLLKKGVIDIEV